MSKNVNGFPRTKALQNIYMKIGNQTLISMIPIPDVCKYLNWLNMQSRVCVAFIQLI